MIKKFISKTKKFIKEHWKIMLATISGVIIGAIAAVTFIHKLLKSYPVILRISGDINKKLVYINVDNYDRRKLVAKFLDLISSYTITFGDDIVLSGFITKLNEKRCEIFD